MRRICLLITLVFSVACQKESEKARTRVEDQLEEPGLQTGVETPGLQGPGKGTRVEFPAGTATASGYLSVPATGSGKRPAILVIQEWWGVDDWIKENTDRFAGDGFVALAPDLYRGHVTIDEGEAHELSRGLPPDRALSDLKGAFQYLASRPDVDPARIGAIGWCMGGGYAATLATSEPRLKAVVINYGHLPTDPAAIGRISAAVLGNFGGADRGIPPDDVKAFELAAIRSGKTVDFKIYPQQGHGFMNPNNVKGFHPEATEDAWRRIFEFVRRTLAG